MLLQKLYIRIWLAVVLAVAVLTLLVGWAWRMAADPPLRDVVVRNSAGEVIGNGRLHLGHPPGQRMRRGRPPPDEEAGDMARESMPRPPRERFGDGPEFDVKMQNGQTMHLHLPRPAPSNWRTPLGFFWTLGLVAVAVALGTYPIVRRLTHRLEALQQGVEQWGRGNLSVRVAEGGRDEVGSLAAGFNRAAQQVEALVQARDALLASQKSLLANASHELRSPLTRIRMGLELMGDSPESATQREIRRNIAELDLLIEEILLASRLDAREADLGTVESVELVGLAAEECARTQAQLEVELEGSELTVPGVSKLLRRAVRNLLENARRYAQGEASLRLLQDADQAIIQVCDHGPGVPEALQERIFEPFYRLPGASERDGGVGLGLALVKSIALRHGGAVACRNRPEGGACFEIRLPKNAKS
ncbi:MAG: HAMP domain-containing histidine kinase [Rhodoferax sp.]|nr:HAMP domain-containing histidine kinase [Rhodoferax sp.]